ncbi:MAG: dTMP kinase [Verrucomicrobiota bacterium]
MFVVFEGIDGSGKTTVSNMVAERLRARGLSVKHLRAEGKFVSAVSEAIRDLGRDARNLELVPQAEFLLYVARDVQLIEEALRPGLDNSDVVLADRFLYTAEVLGEKGRYLPTEFTRPILRAAAGGLEPDLVVLVDVDPVLARARRKAFKIAVVDRRPPSRKGLAGVGLQHRMRRGYLEMAAASPQRWVVVQNEDVLEDTVNQVTDLIGDAHRVGVRAALDDVRARTAAGARSRREVRPPRSPDEALDAFLAWVDQRMEREPRVAAYLLGGLSGPRIDERRRQLVQSVPEAVLAALPGLDDPTSWELRDLLKDRHQRAVARTLTGLPSSNERAAALRAYLEVSAPAEVASSLSRLDDAVAWSTRERLYPRCPTVVAGSLTGLDSDRAWSLRERWLDSAKDEVGSSYEQSCVAVKSVGGLDDDRAWRLRDKVRVVAPVAALASIGVSLGARSWQWRDEYLARAPKVVMGTVRRVSDPRAWRLRDSVVSMCKEAIDSIQDLDDAAAWALREAHADTWPSTVVKTLGPLADGARGKALLERQLAAHGSNVSLLKHVAAVALGLHRLDIAQDA